MLSVLEGEALWKQRGGGTNRACADCHQDAMVSMRGVAARYPAYSEAQGRPINLEERINLCRTTRQNATPLKWEGPELLALTAYVGRQSRGLPVAIADDERTRPFIAKGREMYEQRQGQLNLSCAACHDDHWGGRLAANPIPQAHPTGYPIYRLEWQTLGSLQRRLRGCMNGVRATPYEYGAPEVVNLELYLMHRANGLPVETPAVRP
jgi:sulfur-oxidizing protein SoxA